MSTEKEIRKAIDVISDAVLRMNRAKEVKQDKTNTLKAEKV